MTMLSDAEWLDRNAKVIEEFRANGGRLERQDLVLLTTTGARSGRQVTSPLLYLAEGDTVYVIASKQGSTTHPAWYHNLVVHPEVTLEIGAEPAAPLLDRDVEVRGRMIRAGCHEVHEPLPGPADRVHPEPRRRVRVGRDPHAQQHRAPQLRRLGPDERADLAHEAVRGRSFQTLGLVIFDTRFPHGTLPRANDSDY